MVNSLKSNKTYHLLIAASHICLAYRIPGCSARGISVNTLFKFVPRKNQFHEFASSAFTSSVNDKARPDNKEVQNGIDQPQVVDKLRNSQDAVIIKIYCKKLILQCSEGFSEVYAEFTTIYTKAVLYALIRTVVLATTALLTRLVAPDLSMKIIQRVFFRFLIALSNFMERTIGSLQSFVLYFIIYITSQSIKACILCVCVPFGIVLLATSALVRKFNVLAGAFQDTLQWVYAVIKELYFLGTEGVNEQRQNLMSNSLFLLWDWDKKSLTSIAGNWFSIASSIAIFAPLCEEIVFQGLIAPTLFYVSSKANSLKSYITTAIRTKKDPKPVLIQQQLLPSFYHHLLHVITSTLFAARSISSLVYPLLVIKNRTDLDEKAKTLLLWAVTLWGIFQSFMAFYLCLHVFSQAKERNGLPGAIGSHSSWNINLYLLFSFRFLWIALRRLLPIFQKPQKNVFTILALLPMMSTLVVFVMKAVSQQIRDV